MSLAQDAHGPALIGAFLNLILFGVMVTQVHTYIITYKKRDKLWIKLFVAFLLCADCVNSVFNIYWLYGDIIINYGNIEAIKVADWRLATDPAMVAIIAACVQLFLSWRVKILTGNLWISLLVAVTAIISLCGGLGAAIAIHIVKSYQEFHKFDQISLVWLAAAAASDLTIAVTLSWYMYRNRSAFGHDENFPSRIVRLMIQTGILTAAWATADLILFITIPRGMHLLLNVPIAKIYTTSLMSTLNARAGWGLSPDSENSRQHPSDKSTPLELFNLSPLVTARPGVTIHVESQVDEGQDQDNKWSERSGNDHDPSLYKTVTVV